MQILKKDSALERGLLSTCWKKLFSFCRQNTVERENDDKTDLPPPPKKCTLFPLVCPCSKRMQDAVALLKKESADWKAKTRNDPAAAGVFKCHVGKSQDGYRDCERICPQLWAALATVEVTRDSHPPSEFLFDNSAAHSAYDNDALLVKLRLQSGTCAFFLLQTDCALQMRYKEP